MYIYVRLCYIIYVNPNRAVCVCVCMNEYVQYISDYIYISEICIYKQICVCM